MKNCIEHPHLLKTEIERFSEKSRSKLVCHLKGDRIDPYNLSDEDLCLFSQVASRLGIQSLREVCDQARETTERALAAGLNRGVRRTHSEGIPSSPVNYDLTRNARSSVSVDRPGCLKSRHHQSFFLMIGEDNDKTSVIVYGLKNKRIFHKYIDIDQKWKNLKSACSAYLDEAPYLFFLHVSKKNNKSLTRYDVIEGKMKSRAKPKSKDEMSSIINAGNFIATFSRNSDVIERYQLEGNKWTTPTKLLETINLPVVVPHGDWIYVFSGNAVQCYDILGNRVTKTDIKEFVSTGFGFVFEGNIFILSDSKIIRYDIITGSTRRSDFPHLAYQPLHAAFVRYERVFVLRTNSDGQFEILSSSNLVDWIKELSFPKWLNLICTEIVDYTGPCPFAPFESFDESLRLKRVPVS